MKRYLVIIFLLLFSCNYGKLEVVFDIPSTLHEVSGLVFDKTNELFWMINDSGNKPILYGLDVNGKIIKEIKLNADNHDWEDLTQDKEGNIYIGDFGNNANKRKNLSILKVSIDSLLLNKEIDVEQISFYYPEQVDFPPKKKDMHYDSESFIFFNDSLYIFTKSRSSKDYGKTNLYKIPAKAGNHKAIYISSFNTCSEYGCWVTSADISNDNKRVALLTEHTAFVFSEYKNDDFFSGSVNSYAFEHLSQKESICFKNSTTFYIADERSSAKGGNLYKFKFN